MDTGLDVGLDDDFNIDLDLESVNKMVNNTEIPVKIPTSKQGQYKKIVPRMPKGLDMGFENIINKNVVNFVKDNTSLIKNIPGEGHRQSQQGQSNTDD